MRLRLKLSEWGITVSEASAERSRVRAKLAAQLSSGDVFVPRLDIPNFSTFDQTILGEALVDAVSGVGSLESTIDLTHPDTAIKVRGRQIIIFKMMTGAEASHLQDALMKRELLDSLGLWPDLRSVSDLLGGPEKYLLLETTGKPVVIFASSQTYKREYSDFLDGDEPIVHVTFLEKR
jgi:hypothetical protein